MNGSPLTATVRVVRVLEALGIPYVLVGSVASSLLGIPRATADADMVADLSTEAVPELVQALEEELAQAGVEPSEVLFVATPEDLILSKLAWFRLGRHLSQRQWTDVLGLLQVHRDRLDLAYLRRWAEVLEVTDLLRRALGGVLGLTGLRASGPESLQGRTARIRGPARLRPTRPDLRLAWRDRGKEQALAVGGGAPARA